VNLGISKDLIGHVLVVHVSGDLDVYTAPQLKEALADTFAADGAALVLDLSKVHFIDSTALGVLASSLQQSKSHDGDLRLVIDDPFAFLLAVILDQGIKAERAWAGPYLLKLRLGHLDPARIAADPGAVQNAVKTPPTLQRYVNKIPAWIVAAASRVLRDYDSDAARIWTDQSAQEVQRRLDAFEGIGQKKAAMAVEILARDLRVPIRDLEGSDIAYDVHVRRVFLRTGLA